MGNPITQGFGGPLAFESATVYSDHIALLFSSPPTLTGLAANPVNWTIAGTPASTVTSVSVAGSTVNVYFTPQLNGVSYTLTVPLGIVDGTGYPATAPAFYAYTAIGVGPIIAGIARVDARLIRVLFDKAVNVSDAINIANWAINNGLQVLQAVMGGVSEVDLTTSKQTVGQSYNVTATNIRDLAGNPC